MSLGEYIGAGSGTTKLLLHLNGNSTDSSGNSNNGTDTAITYSQANGKFGQGAGFNGSTSQILFGSYIIPMGVKTVSFWFKSSNTSDYQTVLENSYWDNTSYGTGFWTNTGTGKIHFQLRRGAESSTDIQSSMNVCDGTFRLITGVWDGTTGTNKWKLYINGVLDNQMTATGTETNTPTTNLIIGNSPNSIYYNFNGSIDEVIVENVAWSAEKVKKYYTMTKGRFEII